jgi:hypothetical protein
LTTARRTTSRRDGNLYVGSIDTDQVLRYNGGTGASLGAFVAAGSGGLDGSHRLCGPRVTFAPRFGCPAPKTACSPWPCDGRGRAV